MVPADVALNQTQLFLTRVLAGKKRVLEVGCGNGQLAWRLAHLGLKVVGLDIALPRQRPSHPKLKFEKGDFYKFKDEPFDAVLFTSSLHHLHPLDGALKRASNLLKPGGLVVIDELDLAAPDLATAHWYYELQGLLEQTGAIKPRQDAGHLPGHAHHPGAHGHGGGHGHFHGEPASPLARWSQEHQHLPALSSGVAMLEGLNKVGTVAEVTRCGYLYRELSARLGESARAASLAEWLRDAEEQRIKGGSIRPVGLRAVCRV